MGYFSNGSEGIDFEAHYCSKCIHEQDCPVWELHLDWDYLQFPEHLKDEVKKAVAATKREALNKLIMYNNGQNRCVLFHKTTKPEIKIKTVEDEQKWELIKQKFSSLTLEQLEKL